MKVIKVNSLPLKEVIRDLAKCFETSFEESCNYYSLNIPQNIGSGNIRGINFTNGMGILLYDCTFLEDVEIQFIINEIHPLKFLFCSEGTLYHRFEDDVVHHDIESYESAMVASNHNHGHILRFKKDQKTTVESLEISRREFIRKIDCDLDELNPNLRNLFNDIKARKVFYHKGYYSLQLSNLFDEIKNIEHKNFLLKMFLEGKSYQILTQQLLQYEDDQREEVDREVLRRSEISIIQNASKYIYENISELDTIEDLSNQFNISKKKLQIGFKAIHGTTVNGYVQRLRLELAANLLSKTDLNISEICYMVGISSKSYLSKIFKEEYDLTPSEFRKIQKRKLSRKLDHN